MKPITLHPDADTEITEAARYYESRQPGFGADLLGEMEQAFDFISNLSFGLRLFTSASTLGLKKCINSGIAIAQ